MTAIAAGTAALVVAVAMVASGLGGPGGPDKAVRTRYAAPVVLTAAMLARVTTASRLALANSGRVVVSSRETLGGALLQTGTDDITFAGRNWNDSFSVVSPASGSQPASTESAINRVVSGQAYDYFVAASGLAWYHVTGPDAVASMLIPDPRRLLGELAPGARFVRTGTTVLAGVAVTELTATRLTGLPALNSPGIWPGGSIVGLRIWVDRSGVVRQVTVSGTRVEEVVGFPSSPAKQRVLRRVIAAAQRLARKDRISMPEADKRISFTSLGQLLRRGGFVRKEADATTMTIRFLDIGQQQVITAPAHAIPTQARG